MTPTAAQDVIGVFRNDNFAQVFDRARPIKAKVNEQAQVMSHPVEDGSTVTDFKVILPIEIELSMILSSFDYKSVYKTIKDLFQASTLLTVQTRSDTYKSMIISAMPHDEDADVFDSITLALKLTEVKFATVKTGKAPKVSSPKDKRNSKTSNGGKQQPKEPNDSGRKSSILYNVYKG